MWYESNQLIMNISPKAGDLMNIEVVSDTSEGLGGSLGRQAQHES